MRSIPKSAGSRPQAPRFTQLQMNSLRLTRDRDQIRLRERSAGSTRKHPMSMRSQAATRGPGILLYQLFRRTTGPFDDDNCDTILLVRTMPFFMSAGCPRLSFFGQSWGQTVLLITVNFANVCVHLLSDLGEAFATFAHSSIFRKVLIRKSAYRIQVMKQ